MFRFPFPVLRGASWAMLLAGACATMAFAATPPAPAGTSFERDVMPLLKKYCYECHGDGFDKAGLALDEYRSVADVRAPAARKHWEGVLRNLVRHEMPPADASAFPTDAERETLARFVERELFQIDPARPDPGRLTLRRMNRAEYRNAIRDLIGVDFDALADFPPDDSGYGFDNIGDVLSLPPVLMEKYLATAERLLDEAIVTEPVQSRVVRVPAALAKVGFNAVGDRGDGWVQLISLEEDDVAVELPIVAAGDYIVRFQAYATKTGGALAGQGSSAATTFDRDPGPTRMAIALNDAFITDFVLGHDEQNPGIYEARLGVPAGRQSFRAVMRRQRGGAHELQMRNGRLGTQQPGVGFVKWIEIEGPLPAATQRTRHDELVAPVGTRVVEGHGWQLEKNEAVATTFDLPQSGEVILRAQAYAYQAGGEPVRMEFRVDGRPLQTFDVIAPGRMQPITGQRVFSPQLLAPQPERYELRTTLPAGRHTFSAALLNAFTDPAAENPNLRSRRLIVQHLEVSDPAAPVLTPPLPATLAKLFAAASSSAAAGGDDRAARAILGEFARRAWRRPIVAGELERLMQLYALARGQGEGFAGGVKLAFKATLASPHFLLIGATSRSPAAVMASSSATSGVLQTAAIDEFTLASRLSFFLWSSVPDEELLLLAQRGELRRGLDAQVRRMLASPKAGALVDNFAGQWLQIRSLESLAPDKKLFPGFDAALRDAMQRETALFFAHVLREDRSVFDFLRGDYTFVNERLAKFYGLPGVTGDEFRRVSLAGTPRRGVLTQASVLTLTSNPTRTSPVKRGAWVLENLLGTPPPPPPPAVPELEDASRQLTGTLRQQMEQHRQNPNCASCHARMDPIGFGLENFNAIGAWREKDGEAAIDASGEFASGDTFSGAAALIDVLAQKRADDFRRCLAEKMLTYALGRGVDYPDRPAVEKISRDLRAGGDTFSALIRAVAESFPFQHRRVENAALSLNR